MENLTHYLVTDAVIPIDKYIMFVNNIDYIRITPNEDDISYNISITYRGKNSIVPVISHTLNDRTSLSSLIRRVTEIIDDCYRFQIKDLNFETKDLK